MKLRTLFSACCLLMAGISFVACDDNDVKKVTTQVTLQAPEYLMSKNPDVTLNEVIVKNVNTGVESVAYTTKDTKADAIRENQQSVTVEITVPEGFYNITMNGTISYDDNNGDRTSTGLRSYQEAVTMTEETANIPVKAENSFVYSPEAESEGASGDFVIAEIFFAGTQTPEGKQYHYDTYIRVYNNSNDTLLADGLAITESDLLTNSKRDEMNPNFINERFSFHFMYRIPMGTNLYVAPGESILLADCAVDHRNNNASSYDLTKADFEWYDESSNPNFLDMDNTDVPNLERIYTYSLSITALTTQGNRAYALVRLDDTKYASGDAFMADSTNYYNYAYKFTNTYNGKTYDLKSKCWTIPNSWVIDAVNLCPLSEYEWLVTSPALDKGYTHVTETAADANRYGKAVRRRVAAGKKLQDSNDSSLDFEAVEADPYYKFHE